MSCFTKMKYVYAETVLDYSLPKPGQTICKVLKSLGKSLFLVATPEGDTFVASMPPKFRRRIYIKRNGFVVTEPIPEGKKVRGEIVRILLRYQIKYFHQENVWPEAFSSTVYLDNTFASLKDHRLTDQSDRGVVHGEKFFFIDGEDCKAVKKAKDQSTGATGTCSLSASFDTENYSNIEPNYNKKAVTWMVFSDDEDNDDSNEEESSDEGGSSDEDKDSEEESGDDEEESGDDEEESGDDEEESGDDEEESGDDEKESDDDGDSDDEEGSSNDDQDNDDEKNQDDDSEHLQGKLKIDYKTSRNEKSCISRI